MRDGKEGIKKAINDYDEHGVKVELTEREKSFIEYGYVQCMLQVGYDIATKSESFISGLQEMVIKNETILQEESENSIYGICEKVIAITNEEIKEIETICQEQINYISPLKMKTTKKQNDLGKYNKKVLDKLIQLKKLIENGK